MKEHNCIVCGGISFHIKKVSEYNIHKCSGCGLEFSNPMPTKQSLQDFYSQYHDIRASIAVTKRNAIRNLQDIQKKLSITSGSNILDYGCGNNQFVQACRDSGYENSYGYDQFVEYVDESTRITWEGVIEKKWDMITLWGVLEHLTDPAETLLTLKKMLNTNGIIILTTIYTEGFIPFRYKPPEHTLYFTKKSLEKLSDVVGLEILLFNDYVMEQDSKIYLSILLRTVPDKYKKLIHSELPDFVEIPTNEVLLALKNK